MERDVTWVSLVPRALGVGACELCTTPELSRTAFVVVKHARGGTVEFAVCNGCTIAVRRLAAVAGDQAHFTIVEQPTPIESHAERSPRPADAVLTPEVIYEYQNQFRGPDDTVYNACAYGAPRTDGTWVGWLEFWSVATSEVRRTDRETTQANRDALAYWASGLEVAYLEGAFGRTHLP